MVEARKVEKLQRPSAGVLDGLGAGESASARPERTAGPTGGRKSKNLGGRGCGAGRGAHPLRAPEARRRPARLPGGRPGRRKPAGGGRGAERACERVRGCGWRAGGGGRVCAGGRGSAPPGPRPSQPPGLRACLPPARTGRPPPPLLLAPALHGSLPAAACFVLPSEDGIDLFLIGSYLKGGSAPDFLRAWRTGGRSQPHSPKPGRIL